MTIQRTIWGATLAVGLSLPAYADTIGSPFLVIEGDDVGTASILDFFDGFGPTGVKQVSLTGTISSTIGAPSLVGEDFAFSTSVSGGSIDGSLTLGATTLDGSDIFDASSGSDYQFDPFQDGPGDLNFRAIVFPPFIEPAFETFVYQDAWSDWPTTMAPSPELEVIISVYLNGDLPTRIFDDGFDSYPFIEGALPVERITLGTINGDPIAPVPLPFGLPLLACALGGLGLVRRLR